LQVFVLSAVTSSILVLTLGLGGVGLAVCFAVSLGAVAARADEQWQRLVERHFRRSQSLISASLISVSGVTYAGLLRAHEPISWDPSITRPSSSTSVGTMRLPVKRSTS
jgi:hypothetical protein